MTTLTEKFAALEEQLATQNTALLALLDVMSGVLSDNLPAIVAALDTLNSNGATNTRYLLEAINALYCPCEGSGPLLPGPIGADPPASSGAAFCRRVQYFLELGRYGVGLPIAAYIGLSPSISPTAVAQIWADALADRGIVSGELYAGMPNSVASYVAALVNNLAVTLGNGNASATIESFFSSNLAWETVVAAVYDAESAAAGSSAMSTTLIAADVPESLVNLAHNLLWSSFWNDMFGAVPEVDDSAFDGDICDPPVEGCTTLIDTSYDGENTVFSNTTYDAYDYYHVRVTSATGNFNTAWWLDGSGPTQTYGDLEQYIEWSGDFQVQFATFFPGSATVLVEGCIGEPPS